MTRLEAIVSALARHAPLRAGKGGSFDRAVRQAMPPDPMIRDLLESLLETLTVLREKRRRFDRQLGCIARESATCRRLMTAPGVGPITAVAFAAAVEDPGRFRRPSDVGAYLGLTPARYQSGEADIGGRISKCGDRLTRCLLFEAANVTLIALAGRLVCGTGRRGWRAERATWKARVALARKLPAILFRMMRDGRDFEARPYAA